LGLFKKKKKKLLHTDRHLHKKKKIKENKITVILNCKNLTKVRT